MTDVVGAEPRPGLAAPRSGALLFWTILVCGARNRGDDGAAIAAVDRLSTATRSAVRIREVGQLAPDDLAAALAAGRCLVLDAVRGPAPGHVVDLPLSALCGEDSPASASSHALPLPTVVGLAEALGAELAGGSFLGIAGARFGFGEGLSGETTRGMDAYVQAIERRVAAKAAVARGGAPCA